MHDDRVRERRRVQASAGEFRSELSGVCFTHSRDNAPLGIRFNPRHNAWKGSRTGFILLKNSWRRNILWYSLVAYSIGAVTGYAA